jgi:prepilin-type N-terminal cleavage/methylation domain-containing protein
MKHAFSLLELIFVIVLMGILTGIGFYYSRPDYSRQDAQYTLLQLKEARYRALGNGVLSSDVCVTLTASALSNNPSPKHEIRSTITLNPPGMTTVCFDGLGRPHNGNSITLASLLRATGDITFTYAGKNSTIRLYPQTGYAIIPCTN